MLKLLAVVFALYGVVLYLLKLSGYCFSQLEWKSNRELIEAAFVYELNGGWPNTPAVSDIGAYLAEYPRCCSIVGSGAGMPSAPLLNALFGRRFYTVRIKYPVADPVGEPYYESILMMDCCGGYIPDSYRMGSSMPVPKGPAPRMPRRLSTPRQH